MSNNMLLQYPSLLHLIIMFFLFLLPLAYSSTLIAKPNCMDRCGNISIPFPFGVGSDCSLGTSFNISCNNSTNPPRAYLSRVNRRTQVIAIYLNPPQIRVKYRNLASSCYGQPGLERSFFALFNLSRTQYSLSDENWLTAIGCDDMMAVVGEVNGSFGGGCVSYCQDINNSGGNGSCPDNGNGSEFGIGCCRTPIPRGTTSLIINLTDVRQNWRRERKLYSCSYAFLGEKNQSGFSYPLNYLDNSTKYDNFTAFLDDNLLARITPPVVLDWRIGADSCEEAMQNSATYACQSINSVCLPGNIGGYFCRCSQGYEGNPYLTGGCQDINECEDPALNPCRYICINTPGSFNCSCPKGYHRDGYGRLGGFGCTKVPPTKMVIVSIGLGSGLGFLLLLFVCFWLHKVFKKRENEKRKEKFFKRNGGLLLQQQTNEGTIRETKHFPAKELEKATDHFNESRILGQGGQGTVYKGMLSDGEIVAIKKSKLVDEDQLEQFINEVAILSQINHRNVVRLLGCCLEIEVPLLVYEFVPNGTLFDLIHETNTEFPVSWNMRLKIAADIAGALAYLHSASSIPIYHRDIKSSNILLGEKYIVKVSDFGISKSSPVDQTHLTTMVKGTIGYLDPEYFRSSKFTEKSDVYSFGVVLLELLTGQRPISLASRFLASMEANNLDSILDPQVLEESRKEEVTAVARLAERCLNLNGKMRPTMKAVATELESLRISQMPSTIKDESKEARVCEAKPITISDIEYSWTASGISVASSSSADTHPLMFATV